MLLLYTCNLLSREYQIYSFDFVGSLKSWTSSIDLVSVLKHEIRDGQLTFRGKRVLEVYCA